MIKKRSDNSRSIKLYKPETCTLYGKIYQKLQYKECVINAFEPWQENQKTVEPDLKFNYQ